MSSRSTFDAELILKAVKAGEKRALNRCGAIVRGIAMRSIRTSIKHSAPGEIPRQRGAGVNWAMSAPFKKSIRYELEGLSVVIGSVSDRHSKVPQTLEHGGTTTFSFSKLYDDLNDRERVKFHKIHHLSKSDFRKTKSIHQAARPFMAPALKSFLPKSADEFKKLF